MGPSAYRPPFILMLFGLKFFVKWTKELSIAILFTRWTKQFFSNIGTVTQTAVYVVQMMAASVYMIYSILFYIMNESTTLQKTIQLFYPISIVHFTLVNSCLKIPLSALTVLFLYLIVLMCFSKKTCIFLRERVI